MLQLIYELRKNCCGTGGRDGTDEGSIRGPRGPKNYFKMLLKRGEYIKNELLQAFGTICGTITREGHLGKVLRWIEKFSLEKSEPQRTCL